MAFGLLESSAYLARPEELYEFSMGAQVWRYTSASTNRTLLGQTYMAVPRLRREPFKQDKDGGDDSINIQVPMDLDLVWAFRVISPARAIDVKVLKRHRGDGDDFVEVWAGRYRGVEWSGAVATIRCDGYNSLLKRAGLRLNYGVKCSHMLYGPGCNLNKEDWRVEGPVSGVTMSTISSPAFAARPDGWLTRGYVEYGLYFFLISDHVGDTVTLFSNIEVDHAEMPLTVAAYAGCDRTLEMCWEKFENGLNAEANPWHPDKNPYQTGL